MAEARNVSVGSSTQGKKRKNGAQRRKRIKFMMTSGMPSRKDYAGATLLS